MSLLEVGHEMAEGLYDAGIIDATTMREFDVLCLPIEKLSPRQIKRLRLREKVSQNKQLRCENQRLMPDKANCKNSS